MTSLQHLSDSTLSSIFSFLSRTKEHLLSLAIVCRRFHTLVSIPWTSFEFEPPTQQLAVTGWPLQSAVTKLVPHVCPRLSHVRSLRLPWITMHYSEAGEEYDLHTLQALCGLIDATPQLESLYLKFIRPSQFAKLPPNGEPTLSAAVTASFTNLAHLIASRSLISLQLFDPVLLLAPMVGTLGPSLRSLTLLLNSHSKASRWRSEDVRDLLNSLSQSAHTELELPLSELHLTTNYPLSCSLIFSSLRLPHLLHFSVTVPDSSSSPDFWQSFLTTLPASLQTLALVDIMLPPTCFPVMSSKFHSLTKLDLRLRSSDDSPIGVDTYVDLFRAIGRSIEVFQFTDGHIDNLSYKKRCEFWLACALAMPRLRKVRLGMGTYPDENQIFCNHCPNLTRDNISSYRRYD